MIGLPRTCSAKKSRITQESCYMLNGSASQKEWRSRSSSRPPGAFAYQQ